MIKNITKVDFSSDEMKTRRDENGNIIIDKINFEFESREKMGNDKRIKNWIKTTDGKEYIIKTNAKIESEGNFLNIAELICMEVHKQFGLEYANYDTIIYDGEVGIIVENILKEDEELITIDDLINGADSQKDNIEIIDYLKLKTKLIKKLFELKLSEENVNSIFNDFNKRLLLDLVLGMTDRHTENVSIIYNTKTKEVKLAPTYDSENSLLLENDMSLVYSLSNNIIGTKEAALGLYPKIAVVPKINADAKEINYATIDFLLDSFDEEVQDFAYEMTDNLDIYSAMDSVEKLIGKQLDPRIRAVVSTCVEARLTLFSDILYDALTIDTDWDYLDECEKCVDEKTYDKDDGKYEVYYNEELVGIYETKNGELDKYTCIKEIDYPIINKSKEAKELVFFASRIRNCKRFGGIIGYQTDKVTMKKVE